MSEDKVEQETMDESGKKPFNRANVREVRNYTDGEGREVVELVQTFGKSPDDNIYRGLTTIVMKRRDQHGNEVTPEKRQFNFSIDAKTLRSAFEKFDVSADESIADWQEDQKDRQRIAVNEMTSSIIGPDGKKLG